MEHKIGIPEGCRAIVKAEDNYLIIIVEEKFEPKNGDFVFVKDNNKDNRKIFIFKLIDKTIKSNNLFYHAMMSGTVCFNASMAGIDRWDIVRPATDAEKQQLLDALAAEGKRWNAEEKCIETIKFKPTYEQAYFYPVFNGKGFSQSRIWRNEDADNVLYEAGMCCKTLEEAIALSKKILAD